MKYLILLFSVLGCSQPQQDTRTIYVAEHLEKCVGVAPRQCMLIRESPDEDWSLFYDKIEGFNYEEGFTYEISVRVDQRENPPADASSLSYTLIEIISKEQSAQNAIYDQDWTVTKIRGKKISESIPNLRFDKETGRVSGFAGCNRFFSSFARKGNLLQLSESGLTRMMCPDMQVEDEFISAMEEVHSYKILDKELYLMDRDGNTVILSN